MQSLAELDEYLQSGGILLLPNHHGAQQWQNAVGQWRCARAGTSVVAAPAIHAIDLWLSQLWQTLGLHCQDPVLGWRVLNAAEEELLLQAQVKNTVAEQLLNTAGTARQLREAAALLQLWQLTAADVRRYLQFGDAESAQADPVIAWRWLRDFHEHCVGKQWLGSAARLTALLQILREHSGLAAALLPRKLLWLGFDDPPPLYQELQKMLLALGVQCQFAQHPQQVSTGRLYNFADTASELRAAARWCATTLATAPLAHIGIICPNLHSLQHQLTRIFLQHLPEHDFYCSVTSSLAEHGFFQTAMQTLTVGDTSIDSLALCQWLRSSWLIGADTEADHRSALELRLRKQGELQTQSVRLREFCGQAGKDWHCPLLANAMLQLQSSTHRQKNLQPLSAWLNHFRHYWQLLLDPAQLSRPAHRNLHDSWLRWLDHAQESASLFGNMSREQAIATLTTLARSCALPNGRSAAAVRVLTPVEAAGLTFSHLWVLQLHAESWPGELHPNPCLPLRMQRELKLPAADVQQELQRARRQLTQWIEHSAGTLVLSYPRQVDSLAVEASPLLPAWSCEEVAAESLPAALHPAFASFPDKQLVMRSEVQLLPLVQTGEISGPGSLLTAQANCPFRAFALHRLGARDLPAFQYGLPAAVIGELLHKVLQEFWQVLKQSTALQATEQVDEVLTTAVASALRNLAQRYPTTLTPRFRRLEQQRIEELVKRWLVQERERRPFSVVMTEPELQWCFHALCLNLRLDRVDSTEHGLVVVDYKTGRTSSNDWQAERPRDPQLLLYQAAVHEKLQEPVTAIFHAKLSLDVMEYSGITAADEGLASLVFSAGKSITVTSWAALQQHWQTVLEKLAEEYLQGLVSVAPQFSSSCQYCHLPRLCRINELRKQQEANQ